VLSLPVCVAQAALACCPRLSKHRMQLLPDLLAVLCGLRPLVLLDYVVTSSTELQGLVGRCPALHAWPGGWRWGGQGGGMCASEQGEHI
jgi:hypothetical protein